ncbi:hypothetical protein [Pseudomonas sp. MPB26]|uniref:hypothetical protein n=1 Tax=Pseudomonas sp. MPB26 TaxID=3388491 RepID=UPI003984C213
MSRRQSDADLAKAYAEQLSSKAVRLHVSHASTLGRWLEALKLILNSPVLKQMAELMGAELTDINVDPVKGEISVRYRGTRDNKTVALADIPGGSDIFDALIAAAKVLTPNGVLSIPGYFKDDTVAMNDVQRFYGETPHLRPEQQDERVKALKHHPVFKGQGGLPDDSHLEQILRRVGNAQTLHNMLILMREQIEKNDANVDVDAIVVQIAPHSDLWREHLKQPVTISLKAFITHHGWKVPLTRDDLINLERVLSAPPLNAPIEADFGGLLTKDVPLDEEGQKKLIEAVNVWKTRQSQVPTKGASLFDYLLRYVPVELRQQVGDAPEALLKRLINTPQALALGKQLQEAIGALPTQNSAREALLAALGLEADPGGGAQRNNLAGYDLRQKDNWGRSPAEIVRRFEQHLEARFGPQIAKMVAYQLLAMSAPEFLVKDVPPSMVYGSQQWASFSAAVTRIEQASPGGSAGRNYAQIMQDDVLSPITEQGQSELELSAMRAVIDWGIANGVIEQSADDTYSPQAIDRAAVALQKQADGVLEAAQTLTTPMPTRRELALAELRRVYGSEYEHLFEDKTLLGDLPSGSRKRGTYSLLDIYMSGELEKHDWTSARNDFSTAVFRAGISKLPDIKATFDEQFSAYVDRLKKASGGLFQYQVSQLPVEDRLMIERGKVTTFSLGIPDRNAGPVRPDHPMFKYVNSDAIIIRAELDGKTCHYLYSPSQGKIIKDADPSRPGLQFPQSRLYFSMERPGRPGEQEETVTILWQTLGTPWPSKDKVDFAALSIYPSKSLETPLPGPHSMPRADVPSPRINELSETVGAYYCRGLEDLKTAAKGETPQERDERFNKAAGQFLLSFIPFYDAIKNFKEGNVAMGLLYAVLDVIGFVVPGVKGGSQAIKVGSRGLGAALSFLKGFTKAGLEAVNPLAGIFDIGRGVFSLGRKGFKQLRSTQFSMVDKLRHARGRSGSFDIPHAARSEPIAEGIYRPVRANAEPVPVVAVQRNGKWYAYDQKTMLAYGAPLKGFTPNAGWDSGRLIASAAADAAVDAAIDFGAGLAFRHLRPRQLSHRFEPPQNSAQIESEQQSAASRLAYQAQAARAETLRLEIQQLKKDLAALQGLEAQGPDGAPEAGSDLFDRLDKMEEVLDQLEQEAAEGSTAFHVPFYRHISPPIDPDGENSLSERLNAIEKRMAEVSITVKEIQAKKAAMGASGRAASTHS